jgi:hypothetical protein
MPKETGNVRKTAVTVGLEFHGNDYLNLQTKTNKQTPWSESASEIYRPSDRRLSAK